jgi:hypothetical protein
MSFHEPLIRFVKDGKAKIYYLDDSDIHCIHNLYGPAVIYGSKLTYWICGKYIGMNLSDEEFARLKAIRLKELTFE